MVGLVEVAGPPGHDSRTGAVFDPVKVEIGMGKERGSMNKFAVMERAADQDEPTRLGRTPISTGWVLSDRGATVKARLVARQVTGELELVVRRLRSHAPTDVDQVARSTSAESALADLDRRCFHGIST